MPAGPRSRLRGSHSTLAEQFFQFRARLLHLGGVGWRVGRRARLEGIAEVSVRLVVHFLRGRLAAVLGDARVVLDAHPAYVPLPMALRALLEPPPRQAPLGQPPPPPPSPHL